MLTNNRFYWNKFYNSDQKNIGPSNFAKFLKKKVIKKNDNILDVATGNGRDAFYFCKYANFVFGIDNSKIAIKFNKRKIRLKKINNLNFSNLSAEKISLFKKKNINLIYARFFLHAIKENIEDKFLLKIKKHFCKSTKVALEFRTTKDDLFKKGRKISKNERVTSHYRRFIDLEKFKRKIKKLKFKIIYKKTGKNLSKTNSENPYLCRLILVSL